MRFKIKGRDEVFTDIDEALEFVSETDGLTENDIEPYSLFDAEDEEEIKYKSRYCDEHPDSPECIKHKKAIHDPEGNELDEESAVDDPVSLVRERQKTEGDFKKLSKFYQDPRNKSRNLEPLKTSNAFSEFVLRGYESLRDDRFISSCPYCNISIQNLRLEQEKVNPSDINKKYEVKPQKLLIEHIKSKHIGIYAFLESQGIPLQFSNETDEYDNKTLKPTNKKNVESLSDPEKEELASRINADPELRKEFFKAWLRKLQER